MRVITIENHHHVGGGGATVHTEPILKMSHSIRVEIEDRPHFLVVELQRHAYILRKKALFRALHRGL
jgi:hypothetical protein